MSTRSKLSFSLLGFFIVFATLINGNGDVPFQGNRRPGILEAPTEVPTGENALLYQRETALSPQEVLDLLSEDPGP